MATDKKTPEATPETTQETTPEKAAEKTPAETGTDTAETTPKMVEVSIPRRVGNEDPNYFVSVNGVNYLLPKGKKSKVPDYVAAEINRAIKAEDRYHEKADALVNAARQAAADANIK